MLSDIIIATACQLRVHIDQLLKLRIYVFALLVSIVLLPLTKSGRELMYMSQISHALSNITGAVKSNFMFWLRVWGLGFRVLIFEIHAF